MKKAEISNSNILITSVSRKVPLIMAVKAAATKVSDSLRVIGGDSNPNVIGKYFVDKFITLPEIDEKTSLSEIKTICKKNNIKFVIPTRDQELNFWAKHHKILDSEGINVMISDTQVIKLTGDKLQFSQAEALVNFSIIPTYENIDKISSTTQSFVVKERYGAGAHKIGLNLNKNDAISHAKLLKNPIFQPYINGKEYSVDLYIDKSNCIRGIVCRRRELVVNGESQVTTSEYLPKLEKFCKKLASSLDFYGHIIMQVIRDDADKFHVIEVNARFGGASTLSLKVGLRSFEWFLLESLGKKDESRECSFQRYPGEISQVRYPSDKYINL